MEVPQLNFDTREDLDWVAWFESMSGKIKTSSPGFVARAIAEAKKQKEAAQAEKLQNEDPTSIQTTTRTTDNAKAKKVKEKERNELEPLKRPLRKECAKWPIKTKQIVIRGMKSRYLRGLLKIQIFVALP